MKNIHVLPTDKPSRLAYDFDKLILNSKLLSPTLYKNQNIYITNLEKPKDGDWVIKISSLYKGGGIVQKYSFIDIQFEDIIFKKIILTTDHDLIADKVQEIDDEFLQWFVKNPSCEFVEVSYGLLKPFKSTEKGYMIHLPDTVALEEPKPINNCPKCGLDLVESEWCKPVCTRIDCGGIILSNETLKEWVLKEEPKQKNRKICKCKRAYENPLSEICSLCWNEIYPNEKDEIKEEDLLEPKQETLEKAAKNYANIPLHRDIDTEERYFNSNVRDYDSFIAGAKSNAAKDYWYSQFQQGKCVQVEKIKAQIEMLEGVDGEYYYAIPISRKIESLQKQLKQLEDEN